MAKINDLIAAKKLPEAAQEMYEGFYFMFNRTVPHMALTKEEFAAVVPEFVKKLQTPVPSAPVVPGTTQEPGDEIVQEAATALLKLKFEGADLKKDLPRDQNIPFNIGATYNYVPPSFEGFTANPAVVTGKMPKEGKEQTITYTKKENL